MVLLPLNKDPFSFFQLKKQTHKERVKQKKVKFAFDALVICEAFKINPEHGDFLYYGNGINNKKAPLTGP